MSLKSLLVRTQVVLCLICLCAAVAAAQSLGTAGTVTGRVVDPNNAVVSGATVTISNPVTGYTRTATTEADGFFRFNDVPPNAYQLSVTASGFQTAQQTVSVRSTVPIELRIPLSLGSTTATVDVSGISTTAVLTDVPTTSTSLDQSLIRKLPVLTPGNGLSDVVTLAAPGVPSCAA